MEAKLWKFLDNAGTFESEAAHTIKSLYFPLANEALMSSITPDLHGDIKSGQNTFLLTPVSRIDLSDSRSSRNFWVYRGPCDVWSAAGVSKDIQQIAADKVTLRAGLLWQSVQRRNDREGLQAEILSFVPAGGEPVEIMRVTLTNISRERVEFTPTAAVPIYARSAHNIRDHRHVTSLLQRIKLDTFGVIVKPTLLFDESGHKPNTTLYFVLGWDQQGGAPQYIFPTHEEFCGDAGDLEAPESILRNLPPVLRGIQGREAMGALRFERISLAPGESRAYIILMGIAGDEARIKEAAGKFSSLEKVNAALEITREYWAKVSSQVSLQTEDSDVDNWFRWVSVQPALRRIFGCSFLPDFDYGKGGRGWRDLWQDCLGLILNDPAQVRDMLVNNFAGVKIDGSNATIIGSRRGEFIADRNNISRVWMDHGIWPLLTLDLYMHETGDRGILFEPVPYFHDRQIFRSRAHDPSWDAGRGNKLKTSSGKVYRGSIFEHLLIQALVQFLNVGAHNHIRLEGADWNDGLDMAREKGESVAFSAMYAHNLALLAELLLKSGKTSVRLAKECRLLLKGLDYGSVKARQKLLNGYFAKVSRGVSGEKAAFDSAALARGLREKSAWMMAHIRRTEWLKEGFFNGYYDNTGARVEGARKNGMRMCLASQVFPIISGTADDAQVEAAFKSSLKYLADPSLGGFHLNTDFGEEQHNLGRAFSFVYGDKENGAYFNHMAVMLAFGFYKRGYAAQGWHVLRSIINMALDTPASKMYPCLPEYFDLSGRGMYSYLTGSASWFVLTMLTQVFGIKGRDGDLLVEPKLTAAQFERSVQAGITRVFAGRTIKSVFSNPQRLEWGRYRIVKAVFNGVAVPLQSGLSFVIPRSGILLLPAGSVSELQVVLG